MVPLLAAVHPLVDAPIPPIGSPDLSDRNYERAGARPPPWSGAFRIQGIGPTCQKLTSQPKPDQIARGFVAVPLRAKLV